MVSDGVISMMIKLIENHGATLKNIRIDESGTPEYLIDIDPTKLRMSLDDTLTSLYGIFWSVTYGKVTDSNRDAKISLKYKEVTQDDCD